MAKWHLSLADELKEYGWGEDSMLYCEVYFIVATNARGKRFIGPILGNSREQDVEEIKAQAEAFIRDNPDFNPEANEDWHPWFPCYGSDEYQRSGQEEAYIDAEKTDRPYYPAY